MKQVCEIVTLMKYPWQQATPFDWVHTWEQVSYMIGIVALLVHGTQQCFLGSNPNPLSALHVVLNGSKCQAKLVLSKQWRLVS